MICLHGTEDITKGALHLFKSMPRAEMFKDVTVVNLHTDCQGLNYTYSAGEDPCYPGLHTYFRSEEEFRQFGNVVENQYKRYGEGVGLTEGEVALMDKCMCKKGSGFINALGNSCNLVHKFNLKTQSTFSSKNQMFCAQAPEHIAKGALDLYKSMPLAGIFDNTVVNDHTDCEALNYTFPAGEDPCYPGLHVYFRTEKTQDQFNEILLDHYTHYGES